MHTHITSYTHTCIRRHAYVSGQQPHTRTPRPALNLRRGVPNLVGDRMRLDEDEGSVLHLGNFASQDFDIYVCAVFAEVLQRVAETDIFHCKITNKCRG